MNYDVAVIGAGVIGSMIARELSRYNVKIALVEKCNDMAMATSKANLDYVSIALAFIKDKVRKELAEKFRQNYTQLLETEVQARRTKVQAQILEMAKLRIELEKFEKTYNLNINQTDYRNFELDGYV